MTETNRFRGKAKQVWLKGMQAVGNMAASIANNTKYKVDEVTIQNRRREVMNDLAVKTYALWLKGIELPDELERMLNELQDLDNQLNDMRAAKYASTGKAALPETTAADDSPEDGENAAEIPMPDIAPSPVSTEINGLFDDHSTVKHMAEKVNSTLDQMSERIRSFPVENGADTSEKGQEEQP